MSAARVMRGLFGDYRFWKRDTERAFREAAESLLAHGYTEDQADALLVDLWNAVSGEYGE